MESELDVGGIKVLVVRKDIKNLHLGVHPPNGEVRISAPKRMTPDAIRAFALSKLAWIRQQQRKIIEQEREPAREFLERESHFVWGKRYLIKVKEKDGSPTVELRHRELVVTVRPGATPIQVGAILDEWYRGQIQKEVRGIIAKWELLLGVKVERVFVQRMKRKWGGCRPEAGNIRLNTELARKPCEFLEYIVVHEMVHLLEPSHNARFVSLMDRYLPNWQHLRDELNRLPLREELWK